MNQQFDCHYDGDWTKCDKEMCHRGKLCRRRTSGTESETGHICGGEPRAWSQADCTLCGDGRTQCDLCNGTGEITYSAVLHGKVCPKCSGSGTVSSARLAIDAKALQYAESFIKAEDNNENQYKDVRLSAMARELVRLSSAAPAAARTVDTTELRKLLWTAELHLMGWRNSGGGYANTQDVIERLRKAEAELATGTLSAIARTTPCPSCGETKPGNCEWTECPRTIRPTDRGTDDR